MIGSENIDEFIKLFKEGLTRNHVSVRIYDTFQLGFVDLRDQLFNPTIKVPLRKEKLWLFVMGTTKNTRDVKTEEVAAVDVVWNKGNALRMSLVVLEETFKNLGLAEFWTEMFPFYKEKNIYMYRESDAPNRHTHCNSKASYWAFGYATIGKYFADISEEERQEYMKIHTNCCGIWDGKLVKIA